MAEKKETPIVNLISFKDLTKIYKRSHLGITKKSLGLSGLNLDIKQGEVFGLLGLNGSGKTTTIKLLLGLLRPTEGSVSVGGREMPDIEALKKIGYLPEAAYISKFLTGREAVRFYAKLSRVPSATREDVVSDILEKVGLSKSADRRVSDYSKGMMQRVSMAQALVHNPDVLVMDEPVTGLDPLAIQELRELILWLKTQGKTVLLSSHNISEVEKVCDRIGILVAGKLETVMDNSEWKGHEGKLERIFSSNVKRSESIGPLKFTEGSSWKA